MNTQFQEVNFTDKEFDEISLNNICKTKNQLFPVGVNKYRCNGQTVRKIKQELFKHWEIPIRAYFGIKNNQYNFYGFCVKNSKNKNYHQFADLRIKNSYSEQGYFIGDIKINMGKIRVNENDLNSFYSVDYLTYFLNYNYLVIVKSEITEKIYQSQIKNDPDIIKETNEYGKKQFVIDIKYLIENNLCVILSYDKTDKFYCGVLFDTPIDIATYKSELPTDAFLLNKVRNGKYWTFHNITKNKSESMTVKTFAREVLYHCKNETEINIINKTNRWLKSKEKKMKENKQIKPLKFNNYEFFITDYTETLETLLDYNSKANGNKTENMADYMRNYRKSKKQP